MSKDRWGYAAIDGDGKTLATADSYDDLKQKINCQYDCIFHNEYEDYESKKTLIIIDEPKKYDDSTLGKIAKNLKKSLMDVKRML